MTIPDMFGRRPDPIKAEARFDSPQGRQQWLRNSEFSQRERHAYSELGRRNYAGEGYYIFDRITKSIWVDQYLQRNNMVMNYCAGVIDNANATMMQVPMKPEPYIPSGDTDDLVGMQAAMGYLNYHVAINRSLTLRRNMGQEACISGSGFICTYWDPDSWAPLQFTNEQEIQGLEMALAERGLPPLMDVRKTSDGKIRCAAKVGAVKEYIVPSDLMFVDSSARDFDSVQSFAHVEYPDVETARQRYPEFADKIQSVMVPNDRTGGSIQFGSITNFGAAQMSGDNQYMGGSFSYYQNRTMITHFWNKVGGLWDHIIAYGPQFDTVVGEERGLRTHPYTMYCGRYQSSFWPKSIFHDMLTPSYMLNTFMATMCRQLSNSLKTILMLPDTGAKYQITDEFNQIVYWDATTGSPPVIKSIDTSQTQLLLQLIAMLREQILALGQTSPVGMGDIKARTSRFAIQESRDIAATPLMQIRDNFRESDRTCYRKGLYYWQQYATLPYLLSIVGSDGQYSSRAFLGMDILNETDLRIIDADATLRAKEERYDAAIQMADNPAIGLNGESFRHFVETGDMRDIRPKAEQFNVSRARWENDMMLSGETFLYTVNGRIDPELLADPGAIVETPIILEPGVLAVAQQRQDGLPVENGFQLSVVPGSRAVQTLVDVEQDHELHMNVHREALLDPGTPEAAKPTIRYHIKEHEKIKAQMEQAQMAQMLQMAAAQSSADATGTKETAEVQAIAQAKAARLTGGNVKSGGTGNPVQGGKNSGKSRSAA